jgi:hypothetical protein
MLGLPETIDQRVDTACGCNCHCLCLRFCLVDREHSGIEMIARASGLGMGVGRFSRPLERVEVIAMLNAELQTNQCVEVPPGAGVLQLLVTGVAVGEFIDSHCVVDGVPVAY